MAKEWAKSFYQSVSWKDTRDFIMAKYNFMCQKCRQNPAEIVHHKIWLTPQNINDPFITLNEENLIPVCRECHSLIHEGVSPTIEGVTFNENGELVKI